MEEKFYSVNEISDILKIHTKTIQRYIREGKMKACKLGKAWRVSANELSCFVESMGYSMTRDDGAERSMIIMKGSTVLDIIVDNEFQKERLIASLTAAQNSKPLEYGKSSMTIQYVEPERTIRVLLWGGADFLKTMIELISNIQGEEL